MDRYCKKCGIVEHKMSGKDKDYEKWTCIICNTSFKATRKIQ